MERPPRTHHCPVCKVCVLKRDHHCFFSSTCVGLRNQRYFVTFNVWASLALGYILLHAGYYVLYIMSERAEWYSLFLPVTIYQCAVGTLSEEDTIFVVLLYITVYFYMTSLGALVDQYTRISDGNTSFEEENNIKILSSNMKSDNFYDVFGDRWWLNLIFPVHWLHPSPDDGVHWPNIKV